MMIIFNDYFIIFFLSLKDMNHILQLNMKRSVSLQQDLEIFSVLKHFQ